MTMTDPELRSPCCSPATWFTAQRLIVVGVEQAPGTPPMQPSACSEVSPLRDGRGVPHRRCNRSAVRRSRGGAVSLPSAKRAAAAAECTPGRAVPATAGRPTPGRTRLRLPRLRLPARAAAGEAATGWRRGRWGGRRAPRESSGQESGSPDQRGCAHGGTLPQPSDKTVHLSSRPSGGGIGRAVGVAVASRTWCFRVGERRR